MRRFLYLGLITFLVTACSQKNPIVFQKKSDVSEVTLTLDTSGTFVYNAKSTVGAEFNEKGTYSIEDSLLILHYQFESFEHLCYEIPLENDTSLIMNYKGTFLLFPTIKDIPEFNIHFASNEELMQHVVAEYNCTNFSERVGTHYFALTSGDFSLLFNGKWNISPHYDAKLQ